MFKSIKGILILLSGIFFLQNSIAYAEENGVAENPANFSTNASLKSSENPIMFLSDEELNAIPVPIPSPNFDSLPGNQTDTVIYNVQTKEETIISQSDQESSYISSNTVPSFTGLLPSTPPSSTESVLGVDGRAQITNTTDFPYRTIVSMVVKYPNSSSTYICSGSLADNFHVLTAGHCIHNAALGGWPEWVRIYPGRNGAELPYAQSNGVFFRSYVSWISNQDPEHDWGLITLDRSVGIYTGWMGRKWEASTSSIYTGILNVSGYPGDKPTGTHWWDSDSGHSATANRHFYFMDTFGGQSGSPVWEHLTASNERFILSIHAYGDYGGTPGISNGGTRLNQNKFDQLNTWLAADVGNPPTDKPDLIDDGDIYAGFSPTTVAPGDSISAYMDARNIGTANSGSFNVSFYASTNTIISTGDYLLGTVTASSISPFTWGNADWSGTVPSGIPAGTYYVGRIIDPTDLVDEFDESNNSAILTTPTLTVIEPALGTATLVSPISGASVTDTTPTFTWNAVADSTWYRIWVRDSLGQNNISWHTKSAAGCSSGTGTCSLTPSNILPTGSSEWWIQTYNDTNGNGPWSAVGNFTVEAPLAPPTLITPSGAISDTTPTYTWNAVPGATYYQLYIADSTGATIVQWHTIAAAGCPSGTGTCSRTPLTPLAEGNAGWWVRAYNPEEGNGPWSAKMDFSVSDGLPAATLIDPSGVITDPTPPYTWNAVPGSTWYRLWITDSTGVPVIKWYSRSEAGCPSGTGTCLINPLTSLALGSGNWWVQTYNSTTGNGPWSAPNSFTLQ